MASEARQFRGEGSGRLFPGRDGIRFSFPHQWEKEGCLAVIVAERGIGAVIHEANGYFRRVAGHQRSQAIHVRLVGIRSRVDEKFNERNEAFRRFFLGADQVEG